MNCIVFLTSANTAISEGFTPEELKLRDRYAEQPFISATCVTDTKESQPQKSYLHKISFSSISLQILFMHLHALHVTEGTPRYGNGEGE